MSQNYELELSQVGRKGTVLFETSFGLNFTASLLVDRKVVKARRGPRVTGTRRERVIELLSTCCGARITEAKCFACGKASELGPDRLDFELSPNETDAQAQIEQMLEPFISDTLDLVLASANLLRAIEEVFELVKAGKRVREVVSLTERVEV